VYIKTNDFVKKGDTLFTIDNNDYELKLMKQPPLAAAESNFEVSSRCWSVLANISVSNANVQSAAGNIETQKWIGTCY
jgi:membrane fusion protein (multidrug efflux system)